MIGPVATKASVDCRASDGSLITASYRGATAASRQKGTLMKRSRFFAVDFALLLSVISLIFLPLPKKSADANPPLSASVVPESDTLSKKRRIVLANPRPDEPSAYHTLPATYYSLKDGLTTKLTLNNKGPNPIAVQPTLFSSDGQRLDVPTVTVDGLSFVTLNIDQWVAKGTVFEEGNLQIMYYGRNRELGGHLEIVDRAHSLVFAEEMMAMTAKGQHQHKAKMSQRLEAVSWQHSDISKVRLVLSNTSKSAVAATLKIDGLTPGQKRPASISLPPGQTRILDAEEFAPNGKGKLKDIIGISIVHDGEPGSLLARGFTSEQSSGYSSSIEFFDPAMSVSSKLDGTGMRLTLPNGIALTPFVVARNTATTPSVIKGRLSYSTADGTVASLTLPETQLTPGEMESIDVLRAIRAKQVNRDRIVAAGLEFTYSTEPGTVLVSAHMVSRDGNQVFRIPIVDAKSEPASAAGYPWWIEDSSSTLVHLRNVTDKPRQYTLHLTHEGGTYSLGLKTLQPSENVTLDIRDLRERQVPDAQGHTLPLQASRGQVNWSMRGAENHTLIGRSEQIDMANGISSTYSCMNCCPDSFYAGWVESDWQGFVGGSTLMIASERDSNCYGHISPPYDPWPGWDNTAPSVCSTNSGTTTGESPGQSMVQAIWTAYEWGDWESGGAGECNSRIQDIIAEALCDVLCTSPDGETTASDGWSTLDPTLHNFKQTLTPAGTSFVGRTVTEQDPGNGGPDTCYWTNSAWDPFDKVDGSTWTVTSGNQYKPDQVGYFPGVVAYYRNNGRAPCGTKFKQRMVIDCTTGPITFITNDLEASITATTVTSKRAGVSASKNYP